MQAQPQQTRCALEGRRWLRPHFSRGVAVPYYERAGLEAAADVAIEPGTQDVGASLTITFAIG